MGTEVASDAAMIFSVAYKLTILCLSLTIPFGLMSGTGCILGTSAKEGVWMFYMVSAECVPAGGYGPSWSYR